MTNVRSTLLRANAHKAPDLGGPLSCAWKLGGLVGSRFSRNLSLSLFHSTTINPMPEKARLTCGVPHSGSNLLHREMLQGIGNGVHQLQPPDELDPLQFTNKCNRSTAGAIFLALHSTRRPMSNPYSLTRAPPSTSLSQLNSWT